MTIQEKAKELAYDYCYKKSNDWMNESDTNWQDAMDAYVAGFCKAVELTTKPNTKGFIIEKDAFDKFKESLMPQKSLDGDISKFVDEHFNELI